MNVLYIEPDESTSIAQRSHATPIMETLISYSEHYMYALGTSRRNWRVDGAIETTLGAIFEHGNRCQLRLMLVVWDLGDPYRKFQFTDTVTRHGAEKEENTRTMTYRRASLPFPYPFSPGCPPIITQRHS